MFALCAVALAAPQATVSESAAPIVVDGSLDEPVWAQAAPITELTQLEPVDGGDPPGRTEVRFAQDERALYVGIRVVDTGYPIRARVSARERINADDQVGIYLDTFHDGRSGYIFYFNALGVQQDIRVSGQDWNVNWDTKMRSVGRVLDDGFEIEVALPWRSLKFGRDPDQTWGVIVTRKVPHKAAKYGWPELARNAAILFSQEADLVGVRPPSRGSGLELIPALTASQQWSSDDPLDPLDVQPLTDAIRPSLDLRYGLTPDLGLAATLNPDFSQIESDLADVRLNARFAFQFAERRPFFLDGIDQFQDPTDTLYSRSIAEPIYGVKLTGRDGPTSLGIVHALDRSPQGSIHERGTPGFDGVDVEGSQALNTLARLRLDAFDGGWLGVTAADKRLVGAGAGGVHDIGSVDLGVPLAHNWLVALAGQTSATWDGRGDSLVGSALDASAIRRGGVGTGGGVRAQAYSPGFRRETGFLPQSGLLSTFGWVDHTFTPGGTVDTVVPLVEMWAVEEDDGDHRRGAALSNDVQFAGVQRLWAQGSATQVAQSGASLLQTAFAAGWNGQVGPALELEPQLEISRLLDFGTLGPAAQQQGSLDAVLRVSGIRVDAGIDLRRLVAQGRAPETARLLRSTLHWQWSRSLGARLLVQEGHRVQEEGTEESLVISPLITWLDVPGTAAFIGWTEQLDLRSRKTTSRVVFVKISVLLRP